MWHVAAVEAIDCSGMKTLTVFSLLSFVEQLGLRFSERVERQIEEALVRRGAAVLLTKRRAFEVEFD